MSYRPLRFSDYTTLIQLNFISIFAKTFQHMQADIHERAIFTYIKPAKPKFNVNKIY